MKLPSVEDLYDLNLEELEEIKQNAEIDWDEEESYKAHLEHQIKEREKEIDLLSFFSDFDLSAFEKNVRSVSADFVPEKLKEKKEESVSQISRVEKQSKSTRSYRDVLKRTLAEKDTSVKIGQVELPKIKQPIKLKQIKKDQNKMKNGNKQTANKDSTAEKKAIKAKIKQYNKQVSERNKANFKPLRVGKRTSSVRENGRAFKANTVLNKRGRAEITSVRSFKRANDDISHLSNFKKAKRAGTVDKRENGSLLNHRNERRKSNGQLKENNSTTQRINIEVRNSEIEQDFELNAGSNPLNKVSSSILPNQKENIELSDSIKENCATTENRRKIDTKANKNLEVKPNTQLSSEISLSMAENKDELKEYKNKFEKGIPEKTITKKEALEKEEVPEKEIIEKGIPGKTIIKKEALEKKIVQIQKEILRKETKLTPDIKQDNKVKEFELFKQSNNEMQISVNREMQNKPKEEQSMLNEEISNHSDKTDNLEFSEGKTSKNKQASKETSFVASIRTNEQLNQTIEHKSVKITELSSTSKHSSDKNTREIEIKQFQRSESALQPNPIENAEKNLNPITSNNQTRINIESREQKSVISPVKHDSITKSESISSIQLDSNKKDSHAAKKYSKPNSSISTKSNKYILDSKKSLKPVFNQKINSSIDSLEEDRNDLASIKSKLKEIKPQNPRQSAKLPEANITKTDKFRSTSRSAFETSVMAERDKIMKDLIDYSRFFPSFQSLFSGYYMDKSFDLKTAMFTLRDSLIALKRAEMEDNGASLISEINLQNETENIKHRISKVSNKLLFDQSLLTDDQFFIYKQLLEMQKKEFSTGKQDENQAHKYFRVVASKPEIYDIVCYTLGKASDWRELPKGLNLGSCWNLMWTYCTTSVHLSKLLVFQRYNHLPGNRSINRKDLLAKSIRRVRNMSKRNNKLFDITPSTYVLAKEFMMFVEEYTRIGKDNPLNLWIVKPVGKSRGKGIYLAREMGDVPMLDGFVVQKYLTNPLLIDGYKFDMRIYVLVTGVKPLEIFIYKEGFARLSTSLFSLNNIQDRLVHLTNAAVHNKLGKKLDNSTNIYGGCKISLSLLKYKLAKLGFGWENVWKQIKDIVIKSLMCAEGDVTYCPSSFELFGFDIILDDQGKCWLLEINSSPSLERETVADDQVKLPLVEDTINLVNPLSLNYDRLIEVIERRLRIGKHTKDQYLYSETVQLQVDLNKILEGQHIREYGEIPEEIGNYEMICPSKRYADLVKYSGLKKY